MIVALDSSTPPSAAAVDAARAAGIRLWNGYLATKPSVGLLRPWTKAEFDLVRQLGGTPIAYVSGWDDPAAVDVLATAWGVRPCLDVESGIRGDGPWVQPWLDASGAGLYGNLAVHNGRRAPFHILSWYVNDPHATWGGSAPPAALCGWQWQNSHNEFGVTVDRCWFDDAFAAPITQEETMRILKVGAAAYKLDGLGGLSVIPDAAVLGAYLDAGVPQKDVSQSTIDALSREIGDPLSAVLRGVIALQAHPGVTGDAQLSQQVSALETALRAAGASLQKA